MLPRPPNDQVRACKTFPQIRKHLPISMVIDYPHRFHSLQPLYKKSRPGRFHILGGGQCGFPLRCPRQGPALRHDIEFLSYPFQREALVRNGMTEELFDGGSHIENQIDLFPISLRIDSAPHSFCSFPGEISVRSWPGRRRRGGSVPRPRQSRC
jgi:hypothetical protein